MEMQLAMRNFILVIGIILITFSCKITEGDVLPKIELASTTSAAPTGSSVTKVIGTTGGTLDLPIAGLKVTVPAGAMAAGAILSLTPIKDVLDNEGTGTRISGAWTKPISIEIQISDTDIANYRLYAKMPNGLWVGAISPKVSGNKMLVRLGPNAGTNIKNGKVAAKEYDLAYAKDFYIKPDQAALELGKSQQFTAYAKAGKVPSKYKGSDGKWHSALDEDVVPLAKGTWDDDEVVPLAPSSSTADDDVVPLAPSKSLDDDEVVPLAVHVKEYAFGSKKQGYNRVWALSEQLGSVNSKGKYTAPTDVSSKGKSTRVTFSSTNSTTGQKVEMFATININDGLSRYVGTYTHQSEYVVERSSPNYPIQKEKLITVEEGKLTLVQIIDDNGNLSANYGADLSKENEITVVSYSYSKYHQNSLGKTDTRNHIIGSLPSIKLKEINWTNKDKRLLSFFSNGGKNKYRLKANGLPTFGGSYSYEHTDEYGNTSKGSQKYEPATIGNNALNDNESIVYEDDRVLSGSNTYKHTAIQNGEVLHITTHTVKWDFKKM